MAVLTVSSQSDPYYLASTLATTVREQGRAEVEPTGADGLNQAIRSIAVAREFLAPSGADLVCWPVLVDPRINGTPGSHIKLLVEFAPPGR